MTAAGTFGAPYGNSGVIVAQPSESAFDIVHSDILRFFPELVKDFGGDPDRLFEDVGLNGKAPNVGYRKFVTLLERTALALDRADFGMALAVRQGGTQVYGPLAGIFKHSPTYGEALKFAETHGYAHSLAARVRLRRSHDGDSVICSHDILLENLPSKCQAIEQVILLGHLNAMAVTGGRARVRTVLFRHRPLSPPSIYRKYFGCEVRFDQEEDAIIHSRHDWHCPIVLADRQALGEAATIIGNKFTEIEPPMHVRVRGIILQYLGSNWSDVDCVATKLELHARTLHRRLKDEDISFKKIKDDIRKDLALYLLTRTDDNFTEIAGRLGYAETSVLSRSCARWFGCSPSEIRMNFQDQACPRPC